MELWGHCRIEESCSDTTAKAYVLIARTYVFTSRNRNWYALTQRSKWGLTKSTQATTHGVDKAGEFVGQRWHSIVTTKPSLISPLIYTLPYLLPAMTHVMFNLLSIVRPSIYIHKPSKRGILAFSHAEAKAVETVVVGCSTCCQIKLEMRQSLLEPLLI